MRKYHFWRWVRYPAIPSCKCKFAGKWRRRDDTYQRRDKCRKACTWRARRGPAVQRIGKCSSGRKCSSTRHTRSPISPRFRRKSESRESFRCLRRSISPDSIKTKWCTREFITTSMLTNSRSAVVISRTCTLEIPNSFIKFHISLELTKEPFFRAAGLFGCIFVAMAIFCFKNFKHYWK